MNYQKKLEELSGLTNWEEVNGYDSGVGIDYWFSSDGHEAYVNDDQGYLTITIDDDLVWEGFEEYGESNEPFEE